MQSESGAPGPVGLGPRAEAARLRIGSLELIKRGVSRFDIRDPYYLAVALTWPRFLAALFTTYLLVNSVFGVLFWLVPGSVTNARPHSFADAFFFSLETLATVGYGDMHPATAYGYVVVAIEIMCGVAFMAILTGLTFVRFSRPRPRLLFAPNPVVAMRNGKPTLMVRLGYGRAGTLFDATARLAILLSGKTPAGHLFRRVQEVPLQRAQLPVLPFTWTLMHALDERSPLYGFDAARAIAAQARVFVIFQARDPTLATWVHDIHDYAAQDIRFGLRYADVVTEAADGTPIADMRKIGMLEADQGEAFEEISWTESEGLEDSSSQPGSDIP